MKLDLDKNKHYLLACSNGPDSLTLLHLLKENNYIFDVAIVNYHLREESNEEVLCLQNYCQKNGINLFIKDINYPICKNIEGTCRNIRYDFFLQLTNKYGYEATLVAHHQDDLIETYLLQKKRNNLPIYYGLAKDTTINGIHIIRPLLKYTKKQILEYADHYKLPYSLDKSNEEDTFLRNRIRHSLQKNNIDMKIILNEIRSKNKKLKTIQSVISAIDIHNIKDLLSLDETCFLYAINKLLNKPTSKKECLEIKKILESQKPNIIYKIKGHYLIKSYDKITLIEDKIDEIHYEYKINKFDKLDTPYFYLDFSSGCNNKRINDSDFPIIIRNAYLKDKITIKGYQKKVRRLFIDWKMPLELRKRWPIFVNCKNIPIYIPRYQKDFKTTDNTEFFVKV